MTLEVNDTDVSKNNITGMKRTFIATYFVLLFLAAGAPCHAQKTSAAARDMERKGMVNIKKLDSSIFVSLMYARPDNFTGTVLYLSLIHI